MVLFFSLQYSQVLLSYIIYQDITYNTLIIVAESKPNIRITTVTPYLPSQASYGMFIVRILVKIYCVISVLHCISLLGAGDTTHTY